jgi:hypothetical protein
MENSSHTDQLNISKTGSINYQYYTIFPLLSQQRLVLWESAARRDTWFYPLIFTSLRELF